MKLLCAIVFGLFCVSIPVSGFRVGERECARGPGYWCKNITNAKTCGAVNHCIQTDWVHRKVPVDDDDVCKICLEMVKEARDQLRSNETQEELKEVFEGSCNLIPVKIISSECRKLADEFVPELIETLSSQMNPMVVCSVAGLCNSEWVDKQLEEAKLKMIPATPLISAADTGLDECQGCGVVVDSLEHKLQTTSRDEVLNGMLEACGRIGSLSDSCSAVIITYFNNIYSFLQANLKSEGVCHIAGVCSGRFHSHRPQLKRVEVIHESDVGVMKPNSGSNDLPCELCEQLVVHLRDILVANTTELEFEEVLKGLCKQTGSFKDECLSIVMEYYAVIYNFLVNNLNAGEICKLIGLCGQPGINAKSPIWPLLPGHAVESLKALKLTPANKVDTVKAMKLTPAKPIETIDASHIYPAYPTGVRIIPAQKIHRVPIGENGANVRVMKPENVQLPVDRMLPLTMVFVNNREVCQFCEYFLHYVQQEITNPKTENEIENIVTKACDHLPGSVEGQCREFVETYGNAFIALLAQEIDPAQICPKLGLCPGEDIAKALSIEHNEKEEATCPFCLLFMDSAVKFLKNKKSEDYIEHELEQLCQKLPASMSPLCIAFVDRYMIQIVNLLQKNATAEDICKDIHLCDGNGKKWQTAPLPDILTNEIPDYPVKNVKVINKKKPLSDSSACVICEFVMSKIDEELKDASTEDEIKTVVKDICNHLPKTVATECNQFVDQYADLVIALLAQTLTPQEVCGALKLCKSATYKHPVLVASIKKSVKKCAVCEAAMGAMDELMSDPNIEKKVDQLLEKVCPKLPIQNQGECREMIEIYGPSIQNLISTVADPRLVCMEIGLCNWNKQTVHLLGGKKCAWGPGYWCQSEAHAKGCDSVEYCQKKIWKAEKPAKN